MKSEFLKMLKARRDDAKKRLDSSRKAVIADEANFRLWDAAVAAEEGIPRSPDEAADALVNQLIIHGTATAPSNGVNGKNAISGQANSIVLQLGEVRRKSDILRNALRSAKPLKMSEIVSLVHPGISRATVYVLTKEMVKTGEMCQDKEGRFSLSREEKHQKVLR
jgi:hypothetical protein